MKIKITSKTCIEVADKIAEIKPHEKEVKILLFCITALKVMAKRYDLYKECCQKSSLFFIELESLLQKMLASSVTEHDKKDIAFMVLEDIIIIIREASLKNNYDLLPEERELLSFFEESGLWLADDDSLVSQYYYHRILNF